MLRNALRRAAACLLLSALLLSLGACQNYGLPAPSPTPTEEIQLSAGIAALPERPVRDTVFTLRYDSTESLNPFRTDSEDNFHLSGLLYQNLFRLNADFSFTPQLCEDWHTDNGFVIEIEPKSGVRFQDGSEMSLFDIIYSINLARESERYSARFSRVMEVYADNGKVCIALSLANYNFPALLDIPIVKEGTGYDSVPVGTGPYCFGQDATSVFLRASDYYGQTLPISRFYLREYADESAIDAFESEQLDLAAVNKSDERYLEYGGDFELRYVPTTVMHYLGFNDQRGFCSSPLRRIILNSAVDRTYITEQLVGGSVPACLPINPASSLYLEDVAELTHVERDALEEFMVRSLVEDYDRDGTMEYLQDSVVNEFVLEFIVNKDNPQKLAAARCIAEEMRSLGLPIQFRELGWSEFRLALEEGEYDIFYGEVRLTADFDLTQLLTYEGSVQYGCCDGTLAAYIDAFNAAPPEKREEAARALFTQFADSSVIAPILFERESVYTHRGVVTNMTPAVHDIFNNVSEWTIDLNRNN